MDNKIKYPIYNIPTFYNGNQYFIKTVNKSEKTGLVYNRHIPIDFKIYTDDVWNFDTWCQLGKTFTKL